MRAAGTVIRSGRASSGPASLVQGIYGSLGNLELLACDELGGLLVLWCNADRSGTAPVAGVAAGQWSTDLRFAAGTRYLQAEIVQGVLGPDHLEVLALTEKGVLENWFWAPGSGFERRPGVVGDGVAAFAMTQRADGGLEAIVESVAGARLIAASAHDYPDRLWLDEGPRSLRPGPPWTDATARAEVIEAGVPASSVMPGTARSTRSTRNGGTTELVWRDADGTLRHLGMPDAGASN